MTLMGGATGGPGGGSSFSLKGPKLFQLFSVLEYRQYTL